MSSDEDSPPAKKAKALPVCPYDKRCYRKNPQHFKEYSHPGKDGTKAVPSTSSAIDTSSLPSCEYGAKCYRTNLMHFAEYSHPVTGPTSAAVDGASGSDTDPLESEDEDEKGKKDVQKKVGENGKLSKSYTMMTEDERREMIQRAMEVKKKLEQELQETKTKMEAKEKELKRLQQQVNTGLLLVEGEEEALKGTEVRYFSLIAEREYKEGSADQVHFRLAESQFYRLLASGAGGYQVTKVEYVVNPELVKHFQEAREDLKDERGEDMSYPVLAFHGTMEKNITPICETGFKVPGAKGFKHRTDTGYYGKGVYFSEYPSYSMGYISGCQKLLLCQVLPGKVYKCTALIHGHPLKKGYDSHVSPCGKELIIFNAYHILPSYIVHFKTSSAEFKYKKKDAERKSTKELQKLYREAQKVKPSKVLAYYKFAFSGKLCDTHINMGKFVKKHGATHVDAAGNPNVLVCTQKEFEKSSPSIQVVQSYGGGIVSEDYLYDSVTSGVTQNWIDYTFD